MVWALQLTLFLAYFVLTERRIESSRYDCLCCWTRTEAKPSEGKTEPSEEDPSGHEPRPVPVGILSSSKDSYLQKLLNLSLIHI